MTPEQINAMQAKAQLWHDANPFKRSLLARPGGLHRSPPNDRESDAIKARIDHAHEIAEALGAPTSEL